MTERYLGKVIQEEIHAAAEQKVSGETTRSINYAMQGKTRSEVAAVHGKTMKVTNDIPVAENLLSGRILNVQPYVLRRTARVCRQVLTSDSLGLNSRRQVEMLWERTAEEAARRGVSLPALDDPKGTLHA